MDEKFAEKLTNAISSIDDKNVNVIATAKRLKTEEFCIVFMKKLLEALQDKTKTKLVLTDILVLLQYADKMSFGNQISISQLDIAEELGLDKPRVSRSVSKLIKAGIFYKEGRSMYMTWQYIAKGSLNDFITASKKEKIKDQVSIQKEIELKKKELAQLELDLKSSKGEIPF